MLVSVVPVGGFVLPAALFTNCRNIQVFVGVNPTPDRGKKFTVLGLIVTVASASALLSKADFVQIALTVVDATLSVNELE